MEGVQPRNAGRRFFPEPVIDQIIERVAAGQDLVTVCENPMFPCRATFYEYLQQDATLMGRYIDAQQRAIERRAKQKEAA